MKVILSLVIWLTAAQAGAGVLLYPSIFYKSATIDNNGNTNNQAYMYGDLRLGFVFDFGLIVGATYSLISANGDNSFALTQSAFGPTVGYLSGNWITTFSYYFLSNRDEGNGNNYKYTGGSGYQIDGAYMIPIGNSAAIGPTLTFRGNRYLKREVNGAGAVDWAYNVQDFFPYLGFLFVF